MRYCWRAGRGAESADVPTAIRFRPRHISPLCIKWCRCEWEKFVGNIKRACRHHDVEGGPKVSRPMRVVSKLFGACRLQMRSESSRHGRRRPNCVTLGAGRKNLFGHLATDSSEPMPLLCDRDFKRLEDRSPVSRLPDRRLAARCPHRYPTWFPVGASPVALRHCGGPTSVGDCIYWRFALGCTASHAALAHEYRTLSLAPRTLNFRP
jgi:hypothetical protein